MRGDGAAEKAYSVVGINNAAYGRSYEGFTDPVSLGGEGLSL